VRAVVANVGRSNITTENVVFMFVLTVVAAAVASASSWCLVVHVGEV